MRNVRAASFALGLALLALASPAQALEYGMPVSLRQMTLYTVMPEYYGSPRDQGYAALRLRPEIYVKGNAVRFDAGLEAGAGFSTAGAAVGSGLSPFGAPRPLRVVDTRLEARDAGAKNLDASLDLARLDVQVSTPVLDLDIGRQPVALGSSHFLSVLDVLAPFGPGDLDATFKPGIDALRARRALGDRAEVELILAASDPIDDFATLLRSRFSMEWADFELITGRFRERIMGGVGLETEAGPVGLWAEGAVFQQIDPVNYAWSDRVALSGTVGAEGRPHDKLMLSGGALWQDFGARTDDQYFELLQHSTPHGEGWVYLLGAAHGFAAMAWQAHPLVSVSGSVMVNLLDGSTMSQPAVGVNVADNADINVFGWICTGRDTRLTSVPPAIGSEFGLYPSGGGLYARWFF